MAWLPSVPLSTKLLLVRLIGTGFLAFALSALLLLLLPSNISKSVKPLHRARSWMIRLLYHPIQLSMKGPVFKLAVWFGQKYTGSLCASRCQSPQRLRLKALSTTEVEVQWAPTLPTNPFHQESYICSWQLIDDDEPRTSGEKDASVVWTEKELTKDDFVTPGGQHGQSDSFRDYGKETARKTPKMDDQGRSLRLASIVGGLRVCSAYRFRICALGPLGRSEWSQAAEFETLAPPDSEGGFVGALTGTVDGSYRWGQSKHEVIVRVPIPEDCKPKELRVKVLPTRLEVRRGDEELLSGVLAEKVRVDELFWEVEDAGLHGRCIAVTLRKAELMQKWASLLQGCGHPKIDVKLLRLHYEGNAMNELRSRDLWD